MSAPRSFSGAHPYRPKCVIDAIVDEWTPDGIDATATAVDIAEHITIDIDAGRCPRCRQDDALEYPAGSRATRCRCVLICSRCGADEANQEAFSRTGVSQLWRWPLRKGDITRRANKAAALTKKAYLTIGGPEGPVVLTDSGVGQVQFRPHPGGWAEFGYDDTSDLDEQAGRVR